ncbi:2311_t:CDS:2 [Racocetra fulgida]|uniref:2311_t:CDS:1 n=1 Tax=Racocetra fulgida TaxID=60492 RepID=A0A9N8WKW7_9GLOM|nr:2311_t:CDS:2 [Racocetra fulgida]
MASTRNPYLNKEDSSMNSSSNSSNILKETSEEIPEEILYNAAAQKRIIKLIQNANKELDEIKKW